MKTMESLSMRGLRAAADMAQITAAASTESLGASGLSEDTWREQEHGYCQHYSANQQRAKGEPDKSVLQREKQEPAQLSSIAKQKHNSQPLFVNPAILFSPVAIPCSMFQSQNPRKLKPLLPSLRSVCLLVRPIPCSVAGAAAVGQVDEGTALKVHRSPHSIHQQVNLISCVRLLYCGQIELQSLRLCYGGIHFSCCKIAVRIYLDLTVSTAIKVFLFEVSVVWLHQKIICACGLTSVANQRDNNDSLHTQVTGKSSCFQLPRNFFVHAVTFLQNLLSPSAALLRLFSEKLSQETDLQEYVLTSQIEVTKVAGCG